MATGVASSSTNILSGGAPSMSVSGCFSQTLNALALYLFKMYCLRMGRFSGVGAHGRCGRLVGGSARLGQVHSVSEGPVTPELEHGDGPVTGHTLAEVSLLSWSQEPTSGKFDGSVPKSIHALRDRKDVCTCFET